MYKLIIIYGEIHLIFSLKIVYGEVYRDKSKIILIGAIIFLGV